MTALRILGKTWGVLACVVLLGAAAEPAWFRIFMAVVVALWLVAAEGLALAQARYIKALKEAARLDADQIEYLDRYRRAVHHAVRERRDDAS